MLDLFGQEIKPSESSLSAIVSKPVKPDRNVNPCLALYGSATQGQTCKDCIHLRYAIQRNPKARFWKCDLRRLTHGTATDHRVNWQACGRYEQRTEEYNGG